MKKISKWQLLFCPEMTPLNQLFCFDGVNVFIKRDDLNNKIIQGNKLRKLKYNIKHAIEKNFSTVATFGGAWSNHIIATAAAASFCGLASIGFIRGSELKDNPQKWSKTLIQAKKYGMQLIFLSRLEYKEKFEAQAVKKHLAQLSSAPFLIPQGGSNKLALKGVAEIIAELDQQMNPPTYIITACGTGGTMAGLIDGIVEMGWKTKVLGIPVLKGAEYLHQEVKNLSTYSNECKWQLYHDYHAGGYAKTNKETINFAEKFTRQTHVPLDKIYTSKTIFATYDLINRGEIISGSDIVILHTGGLQGGVIA